MARIAYIDKRFRADRLELFGRWNYGQAGDWADYYRDCAQIVRDFCAGRSIECVIKEGTK